MLSHLVDCAPVLSFAWPTDNLAYTQRFNERLLERVHNLRITPLIFKTAWAGRLRQANLKTGDTDCPTLNGKLPYHIIERGGLTLGFIGLMEREWIATLHTVSDHCASQTHHAHARSISIFRIVPSFCRFHAHTASHTFFRMR